MDDSTPARPHGGPRTLSAVTTPGAGAPLVLLHGVFMDSSMWDRVVALLPGRHVIRVDMPSHGSSPDMPRGASLDDHVAAVAVTLDDLSVSGVVMVGHSWGGMVALRLAHRRPDLVGGLVLTNTPLLRVRGMSRLGFQAQRLLLALGLSSAVYGRMAGDALIGQAHRAGHPADVSSLAHRTRRMGRRRLRETLRAVLLDPADALDLAQSLPVPWTAVAGEDDYVLAGDVRQTLARSGRLSVTRGGHSTPLEDPTSVVTAIRSLLAPPATTAR